MAGTYQDEPVLQVLGTIEVSVTGHEEERYRVVLSDGQYSQSFAVLSIHLSHLVKSGELPVYSIIRLKQHITTIVNKIPGVDKWVKKGLATRTLQLIRFISTPLRRVLIVIDLEILHKGDVVGEEIGHPIGIEHAEHVPKRTADLRARIAKLEAENMQQRAEIEKKDAKIKEQGVKITELVTKIAEHGVKIDKLEASISEVIGRNLK